MKYSRQDAMSYAHTNMRGLFSATLTPMTASRLIDEDGFRGNLRHFIDGLDIDGVFVGCKQGEFFSLTLDERKLLMRIAAEECGSDTRFIPSVGDQNMDNVIELARHARELDADWVILHAPALPAMGDRCETVHAYYAAIADVVDIGIIMWSHPDVGYVMSPELCTRLADLPTIVGAEFAVPRPMYAALTRMANGKLVVSNASEDDWYDNMVELGWQVLMGSPRVCLFQTPDDARIRDYTRLAMAGEHEKANDICDSLEPVREAFNAARPGGKPHAFQKYWQELMGLAGGPVRAPLLNLTEDEKARARDAFQTSGLAG